jgi:hypothetical protein
MSTAQQRQQAEIKREAAEQPHQKGGTVTWKLTCNTRDSSYVR